MFAKYLTSVSLVAALAVTPMVATPAQADGRDVLGALLLGGAIGAAIASQPRTRVVTPGRTNQPRVVRPGIPSTQEGRQVQTALNYFGFDAGVVDGQVGPSTRRAVERYQAVMGYPVNGQSFPEHQAQHLIGAHLWAQNGGQGQTGLWGAPLLQAYGNVLSGTASLGQVGQPGAGTTTVIVNPAAGFVPTPGTTVVPAPGTVNVIPAPGVLAAVPALPPVTVVPAPGTAVPSPVVVAAAAAPLAVPNLFGGVSAGQALSVHCGAVALQGQANGGQITLANLRNPGVALSEQFCGARADAMAEATALTQAIAGMTYEQISVQCQGFSEAVAAQTAMIGTATPQVIEASAQQFAATTGISQVDLAGTARVCLGVGYEGDDLAMAMGSALMLVATGETAYGELFGHHLREGYGVTADRVRALEWFDASLGALEQGEPAVFDTADAERVPLIRQAVAMDLRGQAAAVPVAVPGALPVLSFTPQPVAQPLVQPLPRVVPVAPAAINN